MTTSRAVALAVSAVLAAYARESLAADTTADNNVTLQEVIVTGTLIKGVEAETALPVQVMTAEEIGVSGANTVEQLFRHVSSAGSAGVVVAATATGVLTGGISTISLRGLGSSRTLVLINGQRSSAYGGGSAGVAGNSVDIGSIPVAAIERVDVLKDGASSLYGSDAIGGVVNFILKQNFTGLDLNGMVGSPTHKGGGVEEQASAFYGLGDIKSDGYNFTVGFNFNHSDSILGADRSFATRYSPEYGNDVTSSFAFPANVALPAGGGTRNPNVGSCGPYSLNDINFPLQCRFDNSPYDSLQPEATKYGLLVNGTYALNDNHQLFGLASFSRVTTSTEVQPVPLSNGNPLLPGNPYIAYLANLLATQYPTYPTAGLLGTGAFLLPPTSPYYPTTFATANGQCPGGACRPLNLIYRDFANGTRLTDNEADTIRAVGGIRGTLWGWDYNSSLLYSTVKVHDDLRKGYARYSLVMPILDSGRINPFGPTVDQSAIAEAIAGEFRGPSFHTRTSLTSLGFSGSRALFDLPAGPFSFGAGGEVRRETFKYNPSPAISSGDIAGIGGNQLYEEATRSVESLYVEANAPIIESLVADVAVRADNYQKVGSTVNPKLSLRWQPTDWLLFRGSASTGFRAPSLTDLYAPQARSVTANGTRDPIQCPTFSASNPSCSFQFTTITGGNPDLEPEKATEYSIGTVIEPFKNASINVDTFWIYLKDQIVGGGLSVAVILANAQNATTYASFINRDPVTNNIVSIKQTNANLFKVRVNGFDVDMKYVFDMGGAGRLTWHGNGTYFRTFDTQGPTGLYTRQIDNGLTVGGGVISRWRFNDTLSYDIGNLDVSFTQNYQKRYHDSVSSISLAPRYVGQYQTFDLQSSYALQKNLSVSLGVINLFNQRPPYANYASTSNNFIGGYDISYSDPRGSFAYARVAYKWL